MKQVYQQFYKQINQHTYKHTHSHMSDGNFNRQLLPKTELSSGLRAGRAQMRMKAEKAFDHVIETFLSGEANEKKQTMKQMFMSLLQ